MTNISDQKANSVAANAKSADVKATLTKDIHGKWDKFSDTEIAALKSNDDLIAQVGEKYGLSAAQAKTDVMGLLAGRHI